MVAVLEYFFINILKKITHHQVLMGMFFSGLIYLPVTPGMSNLNCESC